MKFPPFEFVAPSDLPGVIDVLTSDEDAKVLAGGQSLLPLMALRLARPSVVVDLSRLGLAGVYPPLATGSGELRLGAMTRQNTLISDHSIAAAVPLMADAVRHIGHHSTRTLGTLGGSLAHADPAAELPAVMVALGAAVVANGPAGERVIPCTELATGYFSTCLEPDEVLTEIRIPATGPRHGASWCEWAPRAGDFADAGVGVAIEADESGHCVSVMAAACGVSSAPALLTPILSPIVTGATSLSANLLREVAAAVSAETSGAGDAQSELAGLLAARALRRAFAAIESGRAAA